MTHALLAGGPAIDKGNASAVAGSGGVPLHDQRGAPETRVFDGDAVPGARIDIGAFEYRPLPPAPSTWGDYNGDGLANAGDYVTWRKTMGSSVTAFSGADGDGDGTVDPDDLNVWRSHFGQTAAAAAAGGGSGSSVELATLAPVAMANPMQSSLGKPMVSVAQPSSLAAAPPNDEALIAWLAQTRPIASTDREAGNAYGDPLGGGDSRFQTVDLAFSGLADYALPHSSALSGL
jgi:hypothetical protein